PAVANRIAQHESAETRKRKRSGGRERLVFVSLQERHPGAELQRVRALRDVNIVGNTSFILQKQVGNQGRWSEPRQSRDCNVSVLSTLMRIELQRRKSAERSR